MESLHSMFPDFEPDTLAAVLASCENNVQAAVEVLLAMTDERVLSSSEGAYGAAAVAEGALSSATQLSQDEELARQCVSCQLFFLRVLAHRII